MGPQAAPSRIARSMLIKSVPAATGVRWLADGARLLRKQPLGLPAMVGAYLTMLLLPALLPVIGVVVSGILGPFATVGLMQCFREAALGRPPTLAQFAQPFQDLRSRQNLLRLGMINAGLLAIVAVLAALLSPEPTVSTPPQGIQDLPLEAMAIQVLLYAPVMLVMWFAPLLAGWHGMTPGKAMFGSAVGCLRNIGALLVYGAAAFGLVIAASVVVVTILGAIVSSREVLMIIVAPVALVMMTVVQGSFFPMYLSVFSEMPRLQPAATEPADGPSGGGSDRSNDDPPRS